MSAQTTFIKGSQMSEAYMFIVDTKSYAGDFEREMCAYMTGCYGECEVGTDEAEIFNDEVDSAEMIDELNDIVMSRSDDHGCSRPVAVCYSPNKKVNNSFMIFMDNKPSKKLFAFLNSRAEAYDTIHNVKVTGCRVIKEETICTDITTEYKV